MANENRLIDANALNERFDKRIKWLRLDMHDQYSLGLYHGAVTDKDLINEMPTIDAVEVVHGQWGTHSDRPDSLICSVCNCGFDMWKHEPHSYCPNCGAKMDVDTELKEGVD